MLPDTGKKTKQRKNLFITLPEVVKILQYVRDHYQMKYEVIVLLLCTTPLRPQEVLALNILDFKKNKDGSINFERFSYRECKTNKFHDNEILIKSVASRVKLYFEMNKYRLIDGWLFPYYNVKVKGKPYMTSKVLGTWFSDVRMILGKDNKAFLESFPVKGPQKKQYRVQVYSFRRFYETYFYIKNGKNSMASKALREIMYYSSSFDPTKHYVQVIDSQEQRESMINDTFSSLAMMLAKHQKSLQEY